SLDLGRRVARRRRPSSRAGGGPMGQRSHSPEPIATAVLTGYDPWRLSSVKEYDMRRLGPWFPALPALLLVVGCASSSEWTTWKEHSSPCASGDHMMFSVRNSESKPRVSRQDVALARDQAWWGKAITVNQAQIIER